MTPENDEEESADIAERIEEILADAEDRINTPESDGAIGDLAGRANAVISNTSPNELLGALGAPGEDAATIPGAIAKSDPSTVLQLRKLITLSKLARSEDEDTRGALRERFRELSDRPASPGTAEDEMHEHVEAGAGAATKGGDADSSDGTDHAERLKEAFQDRLGEFRDGIQRTREHLAGQSETSSDEEHDDREGSTPREGTMFSTVPPTNRADMTRSRRISTVRQKR